MGSLAIISAWIGCSIGPEIRIFYETISKLSEYLTVGLVSRVNMHVLGLPAAVIEIRESRVMKAAYFYYSHSL